MLIRYFAWLRDHTGCSKEEITCPDTVSTVNELVAFLSAQSQSHQKAFQLASNSGPIIQVAINHEFASFDDAICDSDEVAFFPPVTGG